MPVTMTDAQQLFDYARRQFNEIAEGVDNHFDQIATQLREWIPADATFASRPPPPPRRLPTPGLLEVTQRWVTRHKAIAAATIAFFLTGSVGAVIYVRSRSSRRKRRAKRSASGARTEVVVVAGAVASPLMSALYLDLERRGFSVYVCANTHEDEQYIRSQSRIDLVPFHLDLVDPYTAQDQLARFKAVLDREHVAFDGAEPHKLSFAGLILVHDPQSSPARIDEISFEEWSDAFNAKVLSAITTTQLFLPSVIEHKAKLILLAPSVTPSLLLPGHAMESTIHGALNGFISTLATELRDDGVRVSHFKLGSIDIPSVTSKQRRDGVLTSGQRGTPVRTLNDAVFDALVAKKPRRTWHIGRGSLAYDMIGNWMPVGLVGWMMSTSKIRRPAGERMADEDLRSSTGSLTWEKIDEA